MTPNLAYFLSGMFVSWLFTSLILITMLFRLWDRNAGIESENERLKQELENLKEKSQ